MSKHKTDPLNTRLETALGLGKSISYRQAWDYVRHLEAVKAEIDSLTRQEPERAVALHELFLALCGRLKTTPRDCEAIARNGQRGRTSNLRQAEEAYEVQPPADRRVIDEGAPGIE